MIVSIVFAILYIAPFVFGMGFLVGHSFAERQMADAAVSDPQPIWWRKAVELARGRKAAKEIGQSHEGEKG